MESARLAESTLGDRKELSEASLQLGPWKVQTRAAKCLRQITYAGCSYHREAAGSRESSSGKSIMKPPRGLRYECNFSSLTQKSSKLRTGRQTHGRNQPQRAGPEGKSRSGIWDTTWQRLSGLTQEAMANDFLFQPSRAYSRCRALSVTPLHGVDEAAQQLCTG